MCGRLLYVLLVLLYSNCDLSILIFRKKASNTSDRCDNDEECPSGDEVPLVKNLEKDSRLFYDQLREKTNKSNWGPSFKKCDHPLAIMVSACDILHQRCK